MSYTPPNRAAAHVAATHVAIGTVASQLAIARDTRQRLLVKNTDATTTIWVGETPVTAGDGMELKAGESDVWNGRNQVDAIASAGTVIVAIQDEYN